MTRDWHIDHPLALWLMLSISSALGAGCVADGPPHLDATTLKAASSERPYKQFGRSIDMSDDTLVVGAPWVKAPFSGWGKPVDLLDGGGVFIYRKVDGRWAFEAELQTPNLGMDDHFGWSVSVSGDRLVVGAPNTCAAVQAAEDTSESCVKAGEAYVYRRHVGEWHLEAALKALSADAPGTCAVSLHSPCGADRFGYSVSIDGDTVAVGAPWQDGSSQSQRLADGRWTSPDAAGVAHVFRYDGDTWTHQASLEESDGAPQDNFGVSVAVAADTLAVASQDDARGLVYVFARDAGSWTQSAKLVSSRPARGPLTVDTDGTALIVGAPDASGCVTEDGQAPDASCKEGGAAYVYTRTAAGWSDEVYLTAETTLAGDAFGSSVALSGSSAVVGATGQAGCYVFGSAWREDGCAWAGAAYVFAHEAGGWVQVSYVKQSLRGEYDSDDTHRYFGQSVAVSGVDFAIGAIGADGCETGVDASPEFGCLGSGAVYVFDGIE